MQKSAFSDEYVPVKQDVQSDNKDIPGYGLNVLFIKIYK